MTEFIIQTSHYFQALMGRVITSYMQ